MPNGLRSKLSKLRFQGKITQDEYKELIEKLEGHDETLVAQIKWERDTAIEQLKQLGYGLGEKVEPCEDCVSREALKERFRWLEKATKYGNEDAEQQHFSYSTMMMYEIKDEIDDVIDSLPSVKPQRPQGKWIEQNDTSKHHFRWYYCSNCGAYLMSADGANYCSCCGAEMEGSNE
jgi:hypothetical protein